MDLDELSALLRVVEAGSVAAAELAGHTLLSWRGPLGHRRSWPVEDGGVCAVEPATASSEVHLLWTLAWTDTGIAYLPDGSAFDPEEPADGLVPVLEGVVGEECPLRVVVPEAISREPRVRGLIEQARSLPREGRG